MGICGVGMLVSGVFIDGNGSMVVWGVVLMMCYGGFLLVKMS